MPMWPDPSTCNSIVLLPGVRSGDARYRWPSLVRCRGRAARQVPQLL